MDSHHSRFRVHFVDSSDEGASHEAPVQVQSPDDDGAASVDSQPRGSGNNNSNNGISTMSFRQPYGSLANGEGGNGGSKSTRGSQQKRGWVSNALYNGLSATAAFVLGSTEEQHDPYEASGAESSSAAAAATTASPRARLRSDGQRQRRGRRDGQRSSTSSGGEWEFGSSHHRTSTSVSNESPMMPDTPTSAPGEDDEYDQVSLDLRDTVLLYLQTGSDVFMNIILATLKSSTELVDGETFEIVSGNPTLLRMFLDSGRVNAYDPRVQSVVQSKLDELLAGDPYAGDVIPGELLDYVRCLCNVKTSRITFQQMLLIRYSGFDYIELLIDYPYLLNDLKRPRLYTRIVFSVFHYISICVSWIGVLVALMFAAMVLWTVVYWLQQPQQRNNGYWTITAYVGGYVVCLVATMRSEEGKIAQYDNQIWQYPHNNLRIVPIYPHYEVMLAFISLRYEVSANEKRFFIIRYDLRNGILVQQICNGFFLAMPQLILQTFLFMDSHHNMMFDGAVVYWLLLGSCCALILISIFAYYQIAVFSHSCNSRGFAILSTEGNHSMVARYAKTLSRRTKPSDINTKALVFFTMYFFIAEGVTLFISLLNLNSCSGQAVVFLSIWVAVMGCSIIFLVLSQVFLPQMPMAPLVVFPALVMRIAHCIYMRYETQDAQCILFVYGYSGWIIPSLVCFGGVCVCILGWIGMLIFERVWGLRYVQTAVDEYLCT